MLMLRTYAEDHGKELLIRHVYPTTLILIMLLECIG